MTDPMDVRCPVCGAGPGWTCLTPDGDERDPHVGREARAAAQ